MSDGFQLALRDINKHFAAHHVLHGVNMLLRGGQVYGLCGINGSGKSTLIQIITGVIAADSGSEIHLAGHKLSTWSAALSRRHGIQVIYQDLALFPNLSVLDNILLADSLDQPFSLRLGKGRRQRANQILQKLHLQLDLDTLVETLSIAQRQMVAIARALAQQAKLLILDEPTSSLTRNEVGHLFALVRLLKQQGTAILFVSHRFAEVAQIADHTLVLRDGRISAQFTVDDLTEAALNQAMTGSQLSLHQRTHNTAPPASQPPYLLETRGLTRKGEFYGINLRLQAGEVLGICGQLGAGRSELAQTLFGLRQPDSGQIWLDGQPLNLRHNRDAIAVGIAYLPEDRKAYGLIAEASVADNILLASLYAHQRPLGGVNLSAAKAQAAEWVTSLSIATQNLAQPVAALSGGNQQRVVLAKWLAIKPRLLILDSPSVGVDIHARNIIYRLIEQAAAAGMSIVIISDEVEEVWSLASQVYIMRQGRLSAPYSPLTTSLEQLVDQVYV